MDRNQLVEIKRGQIGTGLLIENDGHLSLNEEQRHAILEGKEKGDFFVPKPFIVDAVFQKYGIENANGRIYPEDVLRKQVKEYQKRIDERRAYGECYRPKALILTESGWKQLAEVKKGEIVVTLNVETNKVELKPIIRKIEYDYVGMLVHLEGDGIDDIVTPDHQFPLYGEDGKFKCFQKAETIRDGKVPNGESLYIPTSVDELDPKAIKLLDIECGEEFYSGKVMCVEVENHIWYVKDNGFAHWTKNCNHPSESTIDLGRISHNITELHWEGHTLVGKMELNITEGYRNLGIVSSFGDTIANLLINGYKIGVSSRGVGSVEQKLGKYIVGDDFELICWDCVSDPSTPNAYISDKGKEALSSYIESDMSNSTKNRVDEKKNAVKDKINKIKGILES